MVQLEVKVKRKEHTFPFPLFSLLFKHSLLGEAKAAILDQGIEGTSMCGNILTKKHFIIIWAALSAQLKLETIMV